MGTMRTRYTRARETFTEKLSKINFLFTKWSLRAPRGVCVARTNDESDTRASLGLNGARHNFSTVVTVKFFGRVAARHRGARAEPYFIRGPFIERRA